MPELVRTGIVATEDYWRYFVSEFTNPLRHGYLLLFVGVTLVFLVVQAFFPWRKNQRIQRPELALDLCYGFFNFFGFQLLGFAGVAAVAAALVSPALSALPLLDLSSEPLWVTVIGYLALRDFVHYWVHRLIHRVPWLWRFHEIHHSALHMSAAAHLRFHPFETVVYRTLEFVPMAIIGFGATDLFYAHAIALIIGHSNHSNYLLPLGPLRYFINSPQMHLLHHACELPKSLIERHSGVNFGLTLSLWDFLFGTAFLPENSPCGDEVLGYPGVEAVPRSFFQQLLWPFLSRREAADTVATTPMEAGE